jgi:hypothetical protein
MKHQSIFTNLWTRLFEKKAAFSLEMPRGKTERPKPMPDEDIKDLFQDFHDCCDDADTDLREAITYSLRILSGQTKPITTKNQTTALPHLRTTVIARPTEPEVGMPPKSKKA